MMTISLPIRLGLVCLGRLTFEHELAARWYADAGAALGGLPGIQVVAHAPLVVEQPDAEAAVAALLPAGLDAVVLISGTFALGGLAMTIAKGLGNVPVMLWAWREPLEQTGKLRLNSLVGANLNASNLYKLGYRPATLYTAHDDPAAARDIAAHARAAAAVRGLRGLRVGLIGGHAPGFDNLAVNKLALRAQLGVEVVEVGLQALVARANAVHESGGLAPAGQRASDHFEDTAELSNLQVDRFDALAQAGQELAAQTGLGALALKCWGDIAEQYGMAACGAVSALNGAGLVTGCEGDVLGALSIRLGQALSADAAVLMDLVSTDEASNTALFWHVGCAGHHLAAPGQPRHLFSHFAGGKGVTAGFGLRPGRVTVLRLGDDGRNLRMLAATGTALDTPMGIRGTVSRVKLDSPAGGMLDEILRNGWEHHVALAYGEVLPEVRAVARMLGVPLTVV